MGDPNTGEIYEGVLRKEGDVPLNETQAWYLKQLDIQGRIKELQRLKRQALFSEDEKVSETAREIAKSIQAITQCSGQAQANLYRLLMDFAQFIAATVKD